MTPNSFHLSHSRVIAASMHPCCDFVSVSDRTALLATRPEKNIGTLSRVFTGFEGCYRLATLRAVRQYQNWSFASNRTQTFRIWFQTLVRLANSTLLKLCPDVMWQIIGRHAQNFAAAGSEVRSQWSDRTEMDHRIACQLLILLQFRQVALERERVCQQDLRATRTKL